MTDLHTHILPAMDDGAANLAESLELLRLEREQGVDTVVLTPHFYRGRESAERFLARRQAALESLCRAGPTAEVTLLAGAEVAWFPSLASEDRLEELCLAGTRQLLLELPFEPWSPRLLDQVYNFAAATGLTPIFAHVERYLPLAGKERLEDLAGMGCPMQMNAASLLGLWGGGKCLSLLRRGRWYVASDCHNTKTRPPTLDRAARVLAKKLGPDRAAALTGWTPVREEVLT